MMQRVGRDRFDFTGANIGVEQKQSEDNERPQDNLDLLKPYLSEGRKVIILVNHQGLGDAVLAVPVANAIVERFPKHIGDVKYVISKTIGNGKQGEVLSGQAESGTQFFKTNHVAALEITSSNDTTRRGETNSKTSGLKILRALRRGGAAIMVHYEGTMDPGRINPETGEIKGAVDMDEDVKEFMTNLINGRLRESDGRTMRTVILPVGINGSYKIWDPNPTDEDPKIMKGITPEVKKTIMESEKSFILRMGSKIPYRLWSANPPLGSVVVGRPYAL